MTDTTKRAEWIEALEGAVPRGANFGCGVYDDNSGHQVEVGFRLREWGGKILLDDGTIAFDHQHAEEVIAAIRYCAAAIRAQEAHNG